MRYGTAPQGAKTTMNQRVTPVVPAFCYNTCEIVRSPFLKDLRERFTHSTPFSRSAFAEQVRVAQANKRRECGIDRYDFAGVGVDGDTQATRPNLGGKPRSYAEPGVMLQHAPELGAGSEPARQQTFPALPLGWRAAA